MGIGAEDFRLFENGQPMSIRAVISKELPVDLVLMVHPFRGGILEGLIRSMERITEMLPGPEDRVAILIDAEPPRIELPFTNNHDTVLAVVRRIGSSDYQSSFSEVLAIEYAVRMLAEMKPDPGRRRVIVRLGPLSGDRYADEPVIRRLWLENIVFCNVETSLFGGGLNNPLKTGFGDKEPDGPLYRFGNPNHIATATGGDSIKPLDPKDPEELIADLRQRYVLWFTQPEGLEPGQERRVSVELTPETRSRYPDAVVRARTGYVTR
jgi:hypothetical protein